MLFETGGAWSLAAASVDRTWVLGWSGRALPFGIPNTQAGLTSSRKRPHAWAAEVSGPGRSTGRGDGDGRGSGPPPQETLDQIFKWRVGCSGSVRADER